MPRCSPRWQAASATPSGRSPGVTRAPSTASSPGASGPATPTTSSARPSRSRFAAPAQTRRRTTATRPWLLGIATNLLHRHAKREAQLYRAYARTGVDPAAAPAQPPDELHPALAGALADMRREHRDVLVLQALGELSCEEIADVMEVPVGTVKSWLHRARATAAERLASSRPLAPHHNPRTETSA